jgi:UDP-N-acetylglucosamine:LPS N-acetylglucosamine transferase
MNAIYLVIITGGSLGVLALAGWLVEAIERRRATHAAEKARRDREDAYRRAHLDTATRVGAWSRRVL